jgi:hypothetical protein
MQQLEGNPIRKFNLENKLNLPQISNLLKIIIKYNIKAIVIHYQEFKSN